MDKTANRFYGEQRVKIKPGWYGVVSYCGSFPGANGVDLAELSVPDFMTADELREAAHLFVQLAEYLDGEK